MFHGQQSPWLDFSCKGLGNGPWFLVAVSNPTGEPSCQTGNGAGGRKRSPRHGSTQEAKLTPAGFIQIQLVLPVDHSSPMKRPRAGSAALFGNSPWKEACTIEPSGILIGCHSKLGTVETARQLAERAGPPGVLCALR